MPEGVGFVAVAEAEIDSIVDFVESDVHILNQLKSKISIKLSLC